MSIPWQSPQTRARSGGLSITACSVPNRAGDVKYNAGIAAYDTI